MKRRLFSAAIRSGMLLAQALDVTTAHQTEHCSDAKAMSGTRQLKLFLAGDVMSGRGIDQVLPHPSNPILHESYVKDARQYVNLAERQNGPIPKPVDYSYVWGDALDIWNVEEPNLRIVNLETSVTTSDAFWSAKGIHYRMHPDNVPCLTAAGIDCCVLANNHVMDWGRAGLVETLTTLRDARLSTTGAGQNIEVAGQPACIEIPGKGNVLVFAFADVSSGVPGNWRAGANKSGVQLLDDLSVRTAEKVAEDIAALRQPSDLVVVSIHWGENWGYDVPTEQRLFAHSLVDNGGVDIVHGHSSHHAKPIEIYRGKPIIYGCGDFITDYEGIGGHEHYRPWLAPMYFVTVSAALRQIERLEIIPLRMRCFQLRNASREDRLWLNARMNKISEGFLTRFEVRDGSLLAVSAER